MIIRSPKVVFIWLCLVTLARLIKADYSGTDEPQTGNGTRSPTPDGPDGNGDESGEGQGRGVFVNNYNAYNFYGQGRAGEFLRRLLQRPLGNGEEGMRGPGGRDKDKDEEYLTRTNYDEFPVEARRIPNLERQRAAFPYGKVPFPPYNKDGGDGFFDVPARRPVYPIQQRDTLSTYLFLLGQGAGDFFSFDDDDDDKKKKKKKNKRNFYNIDDDDGDEDEDDGPLDWTNLCIHECGEGVPNGHHRKCDDCTMYFMCVDGVGDAKSCGSLMFNHVSDQCDVPSSVSCADVEFAGLPITTSEASSTSEPSETSPLLRPWKERLKDEGPFCVDDCFGVPDGTYPSCYSCQKFTECWWGSPWSKVCPYRQAFDPTVKLCRPAREVNCREREPERKGKRRNKDDPENDEGTTPEP